MTTAKFCGACGKPMAATDQFCRSCGVYAGDSTIAPFVATPAPTVPPPTRTRTVTHEYADSRDRERDMAALAARGWTVQNITHIPGTYRGGRGCLLFIIFASLAFLAGRTPDNWLITYATTLPES